MNGHDTVTDFTEQSSSLPQPRYSDQLGQLAIPRHVAIILDGNRRWAKNHGKPVIEGYQAGGRNVLEVLSWCEGTGIEVVTLWPLSADNLKRPPSELQGLLLVVQEVLAELAAAQRWRIHLIGQVDRLPADAAAAVRAAERMTAHVRGLTVNIALAYDGRAEITSAVQALLRERSPESIAADGITEEDIAARLGTHGQPEPDLIIRTSGEQRLSGFLTWQAVYSEILFCPTLWPDFRKADFDSALKWYGTRRRRFGR
jgi:short-chain Z-isoprenyl diphosphate synthase